VAANVLNEQKNVVVKYALMKIFQLFQIREMKWGIEGKYHCHQFGMLAKMLHDRLGLRIRSRSSITLGQASGPCTWVGTLINGTSCSIQL
jgi:hypothetical protein